ncbi:hypothetical protein EDD85DRAFT_793465 [Armillaria nabsnona]|nr:hypothetical protein EDD85DRAFT_793465 [Armillaria nabsnona]
MSTVGPMVIRGPDTGLALLFVIWVLLSLRNRKEQTGTLALAQLLVAGISCYPDSENEYGCRGAISDFDTFELLAFWYHRAKAMTFLLCTPIISRARLGFQGQTEAIFSSGLGPVLSTHLNAGCPCEWDNDYGVSIVSPVAIRTSPRLPNDTLELPSTIADNNRMIRETERARRKHGQFASPLACCICRNQVDDQGYAQKNLTSLTARSLVDVVPQHERQGRYMFQLFKPNKVLQLRRTVWRLSASQNFLQLGETTACLPVITSQTSATDGSSRRIYQSW